MSVTSTSGGPAYQIPDRMTYSSEASQTTGDANSSNTDQPLPPSVANQEEQRRRYLEEQSSRSCGPIPEWDRRPESCTCVAGAAFALI
uniref:Uncharacterized protein n=1 Tax=Kwoniella pini CBS 10737 TaxID=1296096 RepID=A0A1B9I0R8_9TREE|nr:uncharacterized protein I206_04824 [Kwoniella pini CBS 10737]OCF49136.1 hypothetical protein I206_04824 [Kwoniella pini CBS 10737]